MPDVLPITRAEVAKYAGQWIVVENDHVLFASEKPEAAFRWAAEHKIDPDRGTVFAVPRSMSSGWFF